MTENSGHRSEGMGGLAKGLAIIEAFASRDVMSVADAARVSGTTRAAARRCLLTLLDLGYAERIGREFRPLMRLRNLGRGTGLRERLAAESQPILEQARDALNESVSLAVLDGDAVLFIARAAAKHIVSIGVEVGARLPAYCAATGRVLLGGLDDAALSDAIGRKPYPKRTPKTLNVPSAIIREIRAAARAGFALNDEELELGMRSLAVPIRLGDGSLVGAMSVSAFVARIDVEELRGRFLETLQSSVQNLEQRLRNA